MASTLTSKQAYEIASQWGSMMNSYDPGYVFYTFASNKAVVQDEDHRAALLKYARSLNGRASGKEREELISLIKYFETATLPIPPLDEFTEAYVTAALWSTNDESSESGGVPLDDNYSAQDISSETMAEIVKDCAKFQSDNSKFFVAEFSTKHNHESDIIRQAGHDFLLTRNGHGCGFWDGDWTDTADEKLTAASKAFGEFNLYVGDDGKIYS